MGRVIFASDKAERYWRATGGAFTWKFVDSMWNIQIYVTNFFAEGRVRQLYKAWIHNDLYVSTTITPLRDTIRKVARWKIGCAMC